MTTTYPCQPDHVLSAYLDQALPGDRMDQVGKHLATCPDCQARLAALARADTLIGDLPATTPSRGFDAAFWAKVAQSKASSRRPQWLEPFFTGWRPALAAGLAAALVAVLIIYEQKATPTIGEVSMGEKMEMLGDMDLLEHLDLLENWEAVQDMEGQG